MGRKKVKFSNSAGHQLAAIIELPDKVVPIGFALFAHCFTCSKNLNSVGTIAQALNDHGIAVMLFDFTGLGESEGEFENTNFSSNVEDLIDAAGFLKKEFKAPSLLIGHSLGGAAAIFAASKIASLKALATIASPSSPAHISNLLRSDIAEIKKNGFAEVSIGGRNFSIKKQFLDDINESKLNTVLHDIKKPILILHSPQDNIVGIENAAEIFQMAMHPKSFISLDGADHLLSEKTDSLYAGNMIGAWAERYM